VKSEREIRDEVRAVRERVRGFSGYWIGEAAAAIYALEWVNGKRDAPPSKDIGSPGGGHEKIAAALLKIAESAPAKERPAPSKPKGQPER
jgi:hypothetical protein